LTTIYGGAVIFLYGGQQARDVDPGWT